jgi:hypothetical protein
MRIIRQGHRWLLAGALLALVVPARAAEVSKYLSSDTEFVIVVNIKQIVDSPLFKKYAHDKAREALKNLDVVTEVLDSLGFDVFKDLTSVTLAGNGIDPDSKGYIVGHGHFDTAKFTARAEKEAKDKPEVLKILKEGERTIYSVKFDQGEDKPTFVGVIDKTTIVASTEKDYVLKCFDTAAGKKSGAVKKELKELIEKTDSKQSMWMIMPGSLVGNSRLAPQEEKFKKNVEKVDIFSVGLTLEKDAKLAVAIASKNAENAKELAEDIKAKLDEVKGFLTLIAGQNPQLAPVLDLVNAAKVGTEGNTVTLKGEVSEELIEKALKKD